MKKGPPILFVPPSTSAEGFADMGRSFVIIFCGAFQPGGDAVFLLPELKFWREHGFRVILFSAKKPEEELLPPDEGISLEELTPPAITIPALLRTLFSLLGKKMYYRELLEILRSAPNPKNAAVAVKKHLLGAAALRQLESKLRELDIRQNDTVVLYSYWLEYFSLAAAECPVPSDHVLRIGRAHGYDLYDNQPGNGYMPWRRARISRLDHVYAASIAGADFLKKKFPDLKDKISSACLGSDDFSFQEYVPSKTLRLVSCSWLVPVKRVELIIEALAQIKDISIKWTHIGTGPEEEKLKGLAKKLLAPNVQCDWRGFLSNQQVKQVYRTECFDLFVTTSASEGGRPVSISEALSCGIPAAGCPSGGIPEVIIPGETGFLLDAARPADSLKCAVLDYWHLPSERKLALRRSCRHFFEDHCSAEQHAKVFVKRIAEKFGRASLLPADAERKSVFNESSIPCCERRNE